MAARDPITINNNNRYGDGTTLTKTAATANNHTLANDGRVVLIVSNLDSGTPTITITGVASPRTGGDAKTQTHVVPAAAGGVPGIAQFGPFEPAAFNQATGVINIDTSATTALGFYAFRIDAPPAA